jgi:hypothetical protein
MPLISTRRPCTIRRVGPGGGSPCGTDMFGLTGGQSATDVLTSSSMACLVLVQDLTAWAWCSRNRISYYPRALLRRL